jgi:DNA helicase-2/ATP-dependent DNA helicase PcrA
VINENHVHVVDFKTGQFKYGKSKVKPPLVLEDNSDELNFEKRYGGDYWRQILFYKALIESDNTQNLRVLSGEIDFIEPDGESHQKVKIMVNDDEYTFVRNQIKSVFAKIQNLEFEEGCEKDDCQWCTFNKYYNEQAHYAGDLLLHNESDEMDE